MDALEWKLTTLRLLLRKLNPEDASVLASYRGLPEVSKYQSWESFSPGDAETLVREQAPVQPDTAGTWLQLGIVLAESGLLVGDCGVHFRADDRQQVELGITLSPKYQKRGLAAEAIGCLLDYVFGSLGKHRAIAMVDVKNTAASKLFRGVGFCQEGHFIESVWFKGAWGSEYLFAMLNRDWGRMSRSSTSSFKEHFPQFPNPTGKWTH